MEKVKEIKAGKVYNRKPNIKPVVKNSDTALMLYGSDNLFPNNLIVDVQNSLTALNAMDWLTQFIQGDGFSIDANAVDVSKLMLNADQQADEVLAEVASQFAYFQAFCLKVFWNVETGIVEFIRVVPFEKVRKLKDGTLVYNPRYGADGEKAVNTKGDEDDSFYPAFELGTPEEKLQQFEERREFYKSLKGDIAKKYDEPFIEMLYCMPNKPGQYVYPVPAWTGGIDDVKAEFELTSFKKSVVANGFHLGKVFIVPNDDEVKAVDTNGRVLSNSIDDLTEAIANNRGGDNANKTIVYSSNDPNAIKIIELQAMPDVKNLIDLLDSTSKRIVMALGIPAVLLDVNDTGAFNADTTNPKFNIFQLRLNPTQRLIERCFSMLYPAYKWVIVPFGTATKTQPSTQTQPAL